MFKHSFLQLHKRSGSSSSLYYLKLIPHGGLSQWGRSNRPRIRPGTVKSLNAPWEWSQLALRRDYAMKIDPCRMLVWLGRHSLQNMATIGSGQYTLLSGRPGQTGQVLFESKFTTAQSAQVAKVCVDRNSIIMIFENLYSSIAIKDIFL